MAPWGSGLFDIFGELDVFLYAAFCPQILAVKNSLDATGGKATMMAGVGDTIGRVFGSVGCTAYDGAFCINLFLCELTGGLIYIYWRSQVRGKLGVDGNMFGDLIAACCCFPLTVMQEARDLKRGGHSAGVPKQPGM